MAALNINDLYGCKTCANADKYGNGCKIGLLFPVMLVMAGMGVCDNYKFENKEITKEK